MILHTRITGTGEPIVFLHTGLQTGGNDFTYQQQYFSKTHKVISPDLRGHGKSIGELDKNYFTNAAQDLFETLSHYEVKQVHVVGCSLGAIVAVKFAQLYPESVKSLIVSGITLEKPENWSEIHSSDVAFQTALLKNEEMIQYFNQLHESDWRHFLHFARNEDWYPFEDMKVFNQLSFPALIMVGERNSPETAAVGLFPKNNKNVHVAIIPFAAHLVHTEQPELYTSILEDFLNKLEEED